MASAMERIAAARKAARENDRKNVDMRPTSIQSRPGQFIPLPVVQKPSFVPLPTPSGRNEAEDLRAEVRQKRQLASGQSTAQAAQRAQARAEQAERIYQSARSAELRQANAEKLAGQSKREAAVQMGGQSEAAKALLAQADALDRSAADRRARQTRADAGRKDSERSAALQKYRGGTAQEAEKGLRAEISGPLDFDPDRRRAKQALSAIQAGDYGLQPGLAKLTEEERNIFLSAVGRGDWAGAGRYLSLLERDLNRRDQEAQSAEDERYAYDHPVLGTAARLGSALTRPLAYGANAVQAAKNAVTGDYEPTDTNSKWFKGVHGTRDLQAGLERKAEAAGGPLARQAAALGLNLGDMVMQMGVGGLVGKAGSLGLMGASVAGDTTLDSLERGGTPGQALANATVAGAAEVLTEKLPVDQLFDLAKGTGKTGVRQVVRNLLGTMGSEGAQEAVTEIADNLADRAIMGDKSQYETYVRSLMEGGMDERSARNAAAKQFYLSNVGQAAMGGALMGGIMGGGAQLIGYANGAQGRRESRAIDRAYQTNTDSAAPQARKTASTGEAVKINPGARQTIREMISDMPNAGYQVPYVSMPKDALLGPDGVQVAENKIPAAIRRYMSKLFKGKVLKVGSDHKVYIDKGGIEEFTFPAKRMDGEMKTAKMAAGANLDTTLEPAVFLLNVEDDGHHPEATGGWDNFYVKFQTDTGTYSGVVKTKVTDRGRVFHDITEIQKEESPSARGDNGENPPPAWKSTSSFNTMIPQTGEGVKGEFPPKTDGVSPEDSTGAGGSVGAAKAGFMGDTERGFSKNIATDTSMEPDIREDFQLDPDMYHRLGNAETLGRAQDIFSHGTDAARSVLERALAKAEAGAKLSPEMVPLSRMVANELSKAGDMNGAREILSRVAIELTQSGQLSQAANILRNTDPVTVEETIQNALDKINTEGKKRYGRKWKDFELTDSERQEIAKINTGDDDAFSAMYQKVASRVGATMNSTMWEKLTEIRRVAMLLNPKTQVRNVVANVPLALERKAAERISGGIQDILVKVGAMKKSDQTRTFLVSKKSREIAREVYSKNMDSINGSANKWDMDGLVRQYRKYFGESAPGKAMDAVRKFTYDLLEKGDSGFVRSAFIDSAAQYIEAQGYQDAGAVPQSVIDHATQQAMEATFKDACGFTSWLNRLKRNGGVGGGAVDVLLPFTTTPTNLLRRTVDYSPVSFFRILKDVSDGKNAKAADDFAKGLTGLGVIVLGALLKKYDLTTGGADDDRDKAALDRATGKSPYSFGGRESYEWAQPVGTQLAMGAEIWDAVKDNSSLWDALCRTIYAGGDTLMDMTILSNIRDLFKGYGSPTEAIGDTLIQGVAGQFTPSILGSVARTVDGTVRTSYTGGNTIDNTIAQVKAKTPWISKTLPASVNVRGEENKRIENLALRGLQETLNPGSLNTGSMNKIDAEIYRLYEETGSKAVFPSVSPYKIERNGSESPMTGDERARFQKTQGTTFYDVLSGMLDSEIYRSSSDTERERYFELANKYAKAVATEDVTGGAYDSDAYVELAMSAKKELGLSAAEYLMLYQKHGSAVNSDDIRSAYNAGISPYDFLDYKFGTKGIEADKDKNGESISGSKKKKIVSEIDSQDLTAKEKDFLYLMEGYSGKELRSMPWNRR